MKKAFSFLVIAIFIFGCGQRKEDLPDFRETYNLIQKDTSLTLADREDKILAKYLEYKKIVEKPLLSGAIIHKKKETGNTAVKPGKQVELHYRGKLLDGTIFDSSYDRNQPLKLKVGEGKMIMGLEEALTHLNEGEKAEIILPSFLAYGEEGIEGKIPAYSSLIFEVEILSVEK